MLQRTLIVISAIGLVASGAVAQTVTPPITPPAQTATQPATPAPATTAAPAPTAAKPPLTGANSFTETQARDRMVAAGYTTVGALRKDDSGIWRTTAQKSGKPVNVTVDFKGNVVETN